MTEAEEKGLHELSAEIARAEQSPREPRCVSRAFAVQAGGLVLTMQGWIDLDAAHSPLLKGRLPEGESEVAQLSTAVDAFGCGPLEITLEETTELGLAMLDAVNAAFETRLRMRSGEESTTRAPGGFGDWLPILACLIAQMGMARLDALKTPVAQALALIAAHRHNQGWTVADATYAQRDLDLKSQPNAS